MKSAALILCLLAAPIMAGCVFHHESGREHTPPAKPDRMAANVQSSSAQESAR